MEIVSNVFSIIGIVLLIMGVIIFLFQMIGVTKYKFLLNRMHAAGMGDTLGLLLCMLGLVCISGINLVSAKMMLVVLFMWFSSPASSHMISKLEVTTDEKVSEHVEIQVDWEAIKK